MALQALKDLEHRVQLEAEALGFQRAFPEVGPANVKGIELNPYRGGAGARVGVEISARYRFANFTKAQPLFRCLARLGRGKVIPVSVLNVGISPLPANNPRGAERCGRVRQIGSGFRTKPRRAFLPRTNYLLPNPRNPRPRPVTPSRASRPASSQDAATGSTGVGVGAVGVPYTVGP